MQKTSAAYSIFGYNGVCIRTFFADPDTLTIVNIGKETLTISADQAKTLHEILGDWIAGKWKSPAEDEDELSFKPPWSKA